MGYERKRYNASFRNGEIRHAGGHKRKTAAEPRSESRSLEHSGRRFLARSSVGLSHLQKSGQRPCENLQRDFKNKNGTETHISASEIPIDFAGRIHKRV